MTNVMMVLLGVGFLMVLVGVGLELTSNNKILEWIASVMNAIGGFILGATILGSSAHDYIHGIPPRAPDVSSVRFEGDILTLPRPTEVGVRWCVITSETGPKGSVLLADSMKVPAKDDTVRVYMAFPDGRTSADVPISKGMTPTTPAPGSTP